MSQDDPRSPFNRYARRLAALSALRWVTIAAAVAAAVLCWRLVVDGTGPTGGVADGGAFWITAACAVVAVCVSVVARVVRAQIQDAERSAEETQGAIDRMVDRVDALRQRGDASTAALATSIRTLALVAAPDPGPPVRAEPRFTVTWPQWLVSAPGAADWLTDEYFGELRRAIAYVADVGAVITTTHYEARRRQWDDAGSVIVVFKQVQPDAVGPSATNGSGVPVPATFASVDSDALQPVDWTRFRAALVGMLEGRLGSVNDEAGWYVRLQPGGLALAEIWQR